MEETTLNLVITLAYEDATRRNYTFGGVSESEAPNFKDRILAINADMPINFKKTFVSDSGAQCKMISAAKYVRIEEEVIYRAG